MSQLAAALEAYRAGLAEAAFRDRRQVVIKNQQAETLKRLLHTYSLYVEMTAQGDPNIILAAAFIPSKARSAHGYGQPKPNNLRAEVKYPNTGSVHLRVVRWKPARYYQFEYRKLGSMNDWTRVLSIKSRIVVHELQYLTEYEFRVTYPGSNPSPNYSEVVISAVT